MNIRVTNDKLTKIFLYLTVFFLWFEMVMPSLVLSVSFNRLFFVITFVLFLIHVFLNRKNIKISSNNKLNNLIIIFLSVYIGLDLVGVIYSPVSGFAIKQYTTVIPVLMLVFIGYIVINNEKDILNIFNTIGISGAAISLYALFIYFIDSNSKLIYYSRISLVDDYNTFATQIMMATIILLVGLAKTVLKDFKSKSFIIFLLVAALNLPLVVLSGSRRSILVSAVYSVIGITIFLFSLYKNKNMKKLGIGTVFIVICCLVVFFTANLEITLLATAGERNRIRITDPDVASGKYSETDLKDRYDTITSYDGMSKRIYIWKTAINDFKSYSPKEMLIGRGSAYDCYLFYSRGEKGLDRELYDRTNSKFPLGALYSHNILLSDLLNGGLIKFMVQVILIGLILLQILFVIRRNVADGIILLLCWGIILSNVLISSKGILYYKPYWIFILINLVVMKVYNEPNKTKILN